MSLCVPLIQTGEIHVGWAFIYSGKLLDKQHKKTEMRRIHKADKNVK